jgi:hypothetical protein
MKVRKLNGNKNAVKVRSSEGALRFREARHLTGVEINKVFSPGGGVGLTGTGDPQQALLSHGAFIAH